MARVASASRNELEFNGVKMLFQCGGRLRRVFGVFSTHAMAIGTPNNALITPERTIREHSYSFWDIFVVPPVEVEHNSKR